MDNHGKLINIIKNEWGTLNIQGQFERVCQMCSMSKAKIQRAGGNQKDFNTFMLLSVLKDMGKDYGEWISKVLSISESNRSRFNNLFNLEIEEDL